jgi:hypothetical protein
LTGGARRGTFLSGSLSSGKARARGREGQAKSRTAYPADLLSR